MTQRKASTKAKTRKSTDSQQLRLEDIPDSDKLLINKLRERIRPELELVPAYDDDFSLLRWLVGWDRKIDVVVPKIKFSLKAIHALGLSKIEFTDLDKVNEYCDSVSVPLQYLPGSVVGFDKNDNVLVIQMIGRCDASGLMPCTRNADLYVMRIAESEGVMDVIRRKEKELGKQVGTCVIFDLEGINMGQFDTSALKVITTMLAQLQEMFPDVIRHIYIVNAPSFIQMLWNLISPCLAAQTKQKIEFLGNNWREKLRDSIGAENLFRHWGGDKAHDSDYGTVRTGGKVPDSLRYDPANDLPAEQLTKLAVSSRSVNFVPVEITGDFNASRTLKWWWRLDSNDILFSIGRATSREGESVAEHESDEMIFPKFKLQTEFVPECGQVSAARPGLYKLVFDNSYGKLWSKTIRYKVDVVEADQSREDE